MPGTIADRLTVLRAGMLRTPELRRVRSADILGSAASWYGLQRRRFARSIRVLHEHGGLDWIEIAGCRLAWPANVPLDSLVMTLVELRVPSNPHYYFRRPTAVRPDDAVIDVGACEGLFALEAILRRRAERVWCFEPAPLMARALRQTAYRNGLSERMIIVEAAAGTANGVCRFVENSLNPLASRIENATDGTGEEVAAITLDDWADSNDIARVDYLKIDAEGSDVEVLEGARAVLRRFRPRIAATTYHAADHCERMINLLRELDVGYRTVVRGVVTFGGVARPVMLHATANSPSDR